MKTKFAKISVAKKRISTSGFTLIELLVASIIITLVASITGFGLVNAMASNKKANAETQRRVELNRALDFISDEVREATAIAIDANANLSTVAPNFDSTSRTPVLTLQIPGVSQSVIYYIASAGSPLIGPKAVYRWGPKFTSNGQYSNPTVPANCTYEPLADLIYDNSLSLAPACVPNWSLNPSATGAANNGFYACVDPAGRIAEIHLRGKLTDAYGGNSLNIKPFEVSTQAFARNSTEAFTTGTGGSASSGGNTGTITITEPSTMYLQVLGGSITCGAGGSTIPTTTTLNVTPKGGSTTSTTIPTSTKALNFSVTTGTQVTVTGAALAGNCTTASGSTFYFGGSSYNSATYNGSQVLTLRNGDTPPLFAPLGNQPTIKSYLNGYLTSSGKITLADNQVIFLYELGTTDPTSSAYDMQDLIVLATISPK